MMELIAKIVRLLEEKKAEDIVVLDVSKLTNIADYFVIASANSGVHAKALAEHITESFKKEGINPSQVEGLENAYWILIDLLDIIVHIFQKEWRKYYDLEWLYHTAERLQV